MLKLRGFFCLLAVFLCWFSAAVFAQSTGSIKGQLTDATGAAIPGATVTITAGAVAKTTTTGADGTFNVTGLAPGQYALEQTFLVEHGAMVSPESSPLSVLEAMTQSVLV